jgi:hypothetical protein
VVPGFLYCILADKAVDLINILGSQEVIENNLSFIYSTVYGYHLELNFGSHTPSHVSALISHWSFDKANKCHSVVGD